MNSDLNFASILDHISDAFSIIDREWNYVYSNARAEQITGKTKAELTGTRVWDVFPELVDGEFYHKVHQAMEQQETLFFEQPEPVTNSFFMIRCYPVPEGIVVFVQDITATKRAEKALQENEERFRCLATASAQIVWTTAPNAAFMHDLPSWSEFTGLETQESAESGWIQALHPDDRAQTVRAWEEALANGSTFEVEHRLRRHDGIYRHMRVRGVPIKEEDGSIREWLGTHSDITQDKEAEAERQALLESEQRSRIEAEARRQEAMALAQELELERDRLQSTVAELAHLAAELQHHKDHQALVTQYLRGATRTTSQIISMSDRAEALQTVVTTLHNDFNMSVAGIWVKGADPHEFHLAAERGVLSAPSLMLEADLDVIMNPYKLGWVARMKRPFISRDLTADIQLDQQWIERQNVKSAAFYPILEGEDLLGLLVAFSPHEIPLEASEILSTLAKVLSVSLRHSGASE